MEPLVDAVLRGLIYLVSTIIIFWIAGAAYYDVGRASILGGVMSIVWTLTAGLSFLFWRPPQMPFVALLVLLIKLLSTLSKKTFV